MPSHVVDQSVFSSLPALLLVNWAAALCQSQTSPVDLPGITLSVLEHLFSDLAVRYGVPFCGHLVCRRCLSTFKACHLRGVDAGLHKYLTFVLHKVANEGDSDTCHRSTPNRTLCPKLRIPSAQEVSTALGVSTALPFVPSALPAQPPPQAQVTPSSYLTTVRGAVRRGSDTERKESEWEEASADQMARMQRGELGADHSHQALHREARGVSLAPRSFWQPFVPTAPASTPSPRARSNSESTLTPYSSPRRSRSRSPTAWSDCSVRSVPSLFDSSLLGDETEEEPVS